MACINNKVVYNNSREFSVTILHASYVQLTL